MRDTTTATLRPLHRGIRAALGLPIATLGLFSSLPSIAAQEETSRVEEIVVTGSLRTDYLVTESTLGSKFTQSLRDTPQSITLLSEAMMQDRSVMSLDDALRNVPGITLNAGEMKWMGNGPTIRGFSSRNDMYIDGIRDIGFYSRDPFNLEAVEVLMGPSSMAFGRGSTGGIINQSTKKPLDDELRSLHVNVGNAATRRVAVDINQPLNDDARFRLNLMAHEGEVPGRNAVESSRYGIAPSLALDLGDATVLTLNYLYQNNEGDSDYGLPWFGDDPAPVDRGTYYGFDNDWMDNTAHVFSAIVDHELSNTFKVNAQLRYSDYERSSRITEATIPGSVGTNTPPQNVTVQRLVYGSDGNEGVLQGQVNLRADFETGGLSHALVTGVELSRESAETTFGFAGTNRWLPDVTAPVPSTNLVNPVGGLFNGWVPLRLSSDTTSDTRGIYALDTISLNEQWQVMLGLRWDSFETDYREWRYSEAGAQTGYNRYVTEDKEPSYRAALVYKPVEEGTLYLGWGTSFNPATESVSQIDSGRGMSVPNIGLEAQENESIEFGVKWGFLGGRLLLDASLFEIEKTGAYVSDPSRPGFNIEGGIQKVQGGSITLNGSIGDLMQMMVGYTRLDGETRNALNGATGLMDNVPEDSFNFWLNWSVTGKLGIGAGARYIDERHWGTTKAVDEYWTADVMARYRYSDTLGFRLNVVNLTDERYIDQLHPWHLTPGAARSIVFAVDFDY